MCGIAGLYRPGGLGTGRWREQLGAMTNSLYHRGPDAAGAWMDPAAGIALGHRRLAVVDVSPRGSQPMHSHSLRYVITYNGEIYNAPALRSELRAKGHPFRGDSDTEVLLCAIEEHGVPEALVRCEGMFAFAVWDRAERALTLARDRVGEKPLYYGWHDRTFAFASELKALHHASGLCDRIDTTAVKLYLRHKSVPAPRSIYLGVSKLLPGTWLHARPDEVIRPEPYWSAVAVAERCERDPLSGSDAEITRQLGALLRDAVGRQMQADVPLGAFLSGGIDSSLVVALMQEQSTKAVETFTIGFGEAEYDESPHAVAVARHLGVNHTVLRVGADDALALVPSMAAVYDEPFADSSQIPTRLVCELARRQVTVCLSGEGGDELFGGYDHYRWAGRTWGATRHVPPRVRHVLARMMAVPSVSGWDRALAPFGRPWRIGRKTAGLRVRQLSQLLAADTPVEVLRWFVSDWRGAETEVLLDPMREPEPIAGPELRDSVDRMMHEDFTSTLPSDILVKMDRAAMSVGLEGRMPLLDPRVVELAWRLPRHLKCGKESKQILRSLLYERVPRALVDRPKRGFCTPIDQWLRGPLRPWAEDLLSAHRLREDGIFAPQPIRSRWAEHVSGANDWRSDLWSVLMFQAWLDHSRSTVATSTEPLAVSVAIPGDYGHIPLTESILCDM